MTESIRSLSSSDTNDETVLYTLLNTVREDPKAFGELYKQYINQVFRYLYSRIGNSQDAEDITAQTFLAAFEAFDNFHGNGHFAAWLFSIARNKATDFFRRQKTSSSLNEANKLVQEYDTLSDMIQSEQAAELSNLIHALHEDEQELLRLRFLAEMSFSEIARILHRNEDAVKKNLYRLLARLQSQLELNHE